MNLNEVIGNIVDLRYQLIRTQKILEAMLMQNPLASDLIRAQMDSIDASSIEETQKKYPNLQLKKDE